MSNCNVIFIKILNFFAAYMSPLNSKWKLVSLTHSKKKSFDWSKSHKKYDTFHHCIEWENSLHNLLFITLCYAHRGSCLCILCVCEYLFEERSWGEIKLQFLFYLCFNQQLFYLSSSISLFWVVFYLLNSIF